MSGGGTKCRGNERVSRDRSSSAPTGGGGAVTLNSRGDVNGGWGWTVKWKLNRRKNWIPTGGGGATQPPSRSATGKGAPSVWH